MNTALTEDARLRVLVVDDERPALEDLGRLLRDAEAVETVTLAGGGAQALRLLAGGAFDVLFVDVRMPELDGLELAKTIARFVEQPALVFVSAFEDGAVGAFEQGLRPLDYLMKPVSRTRVEQALERVLLEVQVRGAWRHAGRAGRTGRQERDQAARRRPAAPDGSDIIPVEHPRGGPTRLLERASVLYLQADGDYVRVHADSGRYLVRASLSEIERRWGQDGFVRVHRSYIANLHRAVEIKPKLGGAVMIVMADGSQVPVARRQLGELRRRLRM